MQQLSRVEDLADKTLTFVDKGTATTTDYIYDANGNATSDFNKDISNIEYNDLNLPKTVIKTATQKIAYLYDATGRKLKQTVTNGANTTTRYYAGAFEYEGSSLKMLHHGEGRVRVDGTTYTYDYYLKDHLGNTMVCFTKGSSGHAQVLQSQSYYPFGMSFAQYESGGTTNRYLYNGKEMQSDLGLDWYDYGARFYDPVICRWNVQDPMVEKHYDWSSYVYAYNNPILYIDPIGLDTFRINVDNKIINQIAIKDSKSHTYIINGEGMEEQTYTLEVSDDGLVKFPDSGNGFERFGKEDEGGDHYLNPETAAATFGLVTEMTQKHDNDFSVSFGDMSNATGGAPGGDHKTHGGEKGYSGDCIDYRYLDGNSQSYQGKATDANFSAANNQTFLEAAGKWGFSKNYISNKDVWKAGGLPLSVNGKGIGGHNDHGHLTHINKKN